MRHALVIHPNLSILAGGEFVCLNVIQACREAGWKVTLLSDNVDLEKLDQIYGMASLLRKNEWIKLPDFKPIFSRFRAFQAIRYGRQFRKFIQKIVDERDITVIFSTQSSLFGVDTIRSYHFCYGDPQDLFVYPFAYYRKKNRFLYDIVMKALVKLFIGPKPSPTAVFANSKLITQKLQAQGYPALPYVPPIQSIFKSRPKKKQVVMVSRFDRGKRLEWFVQMARLVPEHIFVMICRRDSDIEDYFAPGYSREILNNLPPNIRFYPEPVRAVPQLVEESKAYIYTGNEAGIALVMNEGISAGCIPLAPRGTGNAEIIEALGIGYLFSSPEEGADCIRKALESDLSPEKISRMALKFRPEEFREQIRKDCELF